MSDLNLVDLFAGGGGFSTGAALASKELCLKPSLLAINHWNAAVETHRKNHPWARHLCTGLECVNPTDVAPARLHLLTASPECTHHARARGARPMSDQSRSSAWLVLKWLQELYVESVLIENVQEFVEWGPLGADSRPLKSMRGALFNQFIASLKALGYAVEWRVLNAANYGGATTRERLFIMAKRGKNRRILWPDQTHFRVSKSEQEEMFSGSLRWRPAREIIDWSLPSQSIFRRSRPLAPTTLARIEAGLRKFGGANAEPFLVVLRRHMDGRSLDEPVPTVTAGGYHLGLCQPFMLGQQSGSTPRSTDQPVMTIATDGAISLTTPFIMTAAHGDEGPGSRNRRVHDPDSPLPTVTAGGIQHALIEPFLCTAGGPTGQGRHPKSINEPMPTIMTDDRHAVVEPFLTTVTHGEGDTRVYDASRPLPTISTKNGFGVCEPIMIGFYGSQNTYPVSEPVPTISTKDRFGLVECRAEDGTQFALDIHFRMLHWRELARAMSFPEWYQFVGSKADIVKMIGNAVEVKTATALAKAALAS